VAEVQDKEVGIKVDMNRVVEKLKAQWSARVADLEYQVAVMEVALEDAVREREEAEEENRRLRAESMKPPGE
jgi:hypothetical protein